MSDLFTYNTSFYNYYPSSFSTYSFSDYSMMDWLPAYYSNETVSTSARFNLNETGTNFREYTWTENRFKSDFGVLTTPSLSSLNNVNRFYGQNEFMNDFTNYQITNTIKEGFNFMSGLGSGMGSFISDTLNSSADLFSCVMYGDYDAAQRIGNGFVDSIKNIPKLPQMFGNLMDSYQNAGNFEKGEMIGYSSLALTSALMPFVGKTKFGAIYKAGDKVDDVAGVTKSGKYDVGIYNEIKGATGLDAHHVGQKSLMSEFVPDYNLNTAPAILVPREGHTVRSLSRGIVSRSSEGITNVRQLIARDIMELRRVYPDIPNSQLRKLINLNKELYPIIRSK